MAQDVARTEEKPAVHPVDQVLPVPKLAIYGFQHVLAFYAGAVIVPILLATQIGLTPEQLAYLINADLFTCGIASIIQTIGFWKIGVRLPLLQGVTFAAVSPMISIGLAEGGGVPGLTGDLRRRHHRRNRHLPGRPVLRQPHPAVPAGRHGHGHHDHRCSPAVGGGPRRRRRRCQPGGRYVRRPRQPGVGRLHPGVHPGALSVLQGLRRYHRGPDRARRRHRRRGDLRVHRFQPRRRSGHVRCDDAVLLRDSHLQRRGHHRDGHRDADHDGRDHRRRLRLCRHRREAGRQDRRRSRTARRRSGDDSRRRAQLVSRTPASPRTSASYG